MRGQMKVGAKKNIARTSLIGSGYIGLNRKKLSKVKQQNNQKDQSNWSFRY